MRNQRSLDLLHADPGRWLLSRHLFIGSDAAAGGPVRPFTFGAMASGFAPDPAAQGSAARKGWWETDHDKGRAARSILPAANGAGLLEGVTENMGYVPMQSAADVNLSGTAFMTPLAAFGGVRFAVTCQLTGCCFVWDKAAGLVGHVQPTNNIDGDRLRTALADRHTCFGRRGPGGGDYDIAGEDVTIIGVKWSGWHFFAQVHVRTTKRVQRVVEL